MEIEDILLASTHPQELHTTVGPGTMPPNRTAVAAAAEERLRQQSLGSSVATQYVNFDNNHEKRQEFRRMIHTTILRDNSRKLALEALQTLEKLARNLLSNPGEDKYLRFKTTNSKVKQLLVEPKGTLEYARALGFQPKVVNFQPYYEFNTRHMADLKIGVDMLKEALDIEMEKEEREQCRQQEEKAASAAAVANVMLLFYLKMIELIST
ncbi:hypothetical protein AcV5_001189 [Taiwanofungus camphoratus]|nr:hypothetical protein AcV5_001189 [Antrodia cinnamomea]